jgi:plastocyanin
MWKQMNNHTIINGDSFFIAITVFIMIMLIMLCTLFAIQNPLLVTAADAVQREEQPDISASTLFKIHSMRLGDNIKNLEILIPDEAHESTNQSKDQYPFINQPYLPQNAVVNVGTTVTWFNGDVDHDHKIILHDRSTNARFEGGDFTYNTASKPIKFNDTGTFNFFETDVNDNESQIFSYEYRILNLFI